MIAPSAPRHDNSMPYRYLKVWSRPGTSVQPIARVRHLARVPMLRVPAMVTATHVAVPAWAILADVFRSCALLNAARDGLTFRERPTF